MGIDAYNEALVESSDDFNVDTRQKSGDPIYGIETESQQAPPLMMKSFQTI